MCVLAIQFILGQIYSNLSSVESDSDFCTMSTYHHLVDWTFTYIYIYIYLKEACNNIFIASQALGWSFKLCSVAIAAIFVQTANHAFVTQIYYVCNLLHSKTHNSAVFCKTFFSIIWQAAHFWRSDAVRFHSTKAESDN